MYILFDIGGTKTRIGATSSLDSIGETVSFSTPHDFNEAMQVFAEKVAGLTEGARVLAAAGGIRGPLSKDKSTIIENEVLSGWVEQPIVGKVSMACGNAHVTLLNDTAIVGLGEAHYGAGKGYDIVAYHTVSTGVGGARIVAGSLDEASVGFEPGHQIIDADGSLNGPHSGPETLEDLISGTAIEKRFGKKPYEISQGDPMWDELAEYLAFGLKNTIVYWSPDVIVLGGSMMIGDPRILREDVIRHTNRVMGEFVPVPPILDATLADKGGLYGALAVLSSQK
jgi:predicted NBD/HSP70 family sugar kinase